MRRASAACMVFFLLFFFWAIKGVPLRGDSKARREGGGKKVGVEEGEREESTPKLVAAGFHRELPLGYFLNFTVSAKGIEQIRETPEQ